MPAVEEKRTGFLQVPNVFFETCALPDTAQMLFLRLAAFLGKHHQTKYVGSTRQLANVVRMSKSTVDRMLKRLKTAKLATITSEPGKETKHEVMGITLAMDALWDLNTYHNTVTSVPVWDNELPDCPNLGQSVPEEGQSNVNLGQSVPDGDKVSQSQAQIRDNTLNTENTSLILEEDSTPPPSAQASSVSFSLEEETILSQLKQERIPIKKDVQAVKKQLAVLIPSLDNAELLHKYCVYAKEQYRDRKNPVVALGNLASQGLLDSFLQALEAEQSTIVEGPEALSQGQYEGLLEEIQEYRPELVVQVGSDGNGPFIDVLFGDGEFDCVRIWDREEWQSFQGDSWAMPRAIAYGSRSLEIAV